MRFDIVTIFPDFFRVLDLSLLGKAQAHGLLDTHIHDLREWTYDRHRSVDDTPYGGGAGMVMRADVWGRALNQILGVETEIASFSGEQKNPGPETIPSGKRKILAIPTPSGQPFTQRLAEKLAAEATQIVFACGRYEGIDSRVAQVYASHPEVQVLEFSLGDYVLNGGEVATLAVIEAVGRLCTGVVGNPESLVEESHGESGLLEYPVYTKPGTWADTAVPEVLLGGHHARIERWRRDRSLTVTAQRRPDLITAQPVDSWDRTDRAVLAAQGFYWETRSKITAEVASANPKPTIPQKSVTGQNIPAAVAPSNQQIAMATAEQCRFLPLGAAMKEKLIPSPRHTLARWEGSYATIVGATQQAEWLSKSVSTWAAELSELAGKLFPLACPDFLTPAQISQFVTSELNPDQFANFLDDSNCLIVLAQKLTATGSWQSVGYTMTFIPPAGQKVSDPQVASQTDPNLAYLSKCYLDHNCQGSGLAAALLEVTHALTVTRFPYVDGFVLGTHRDNRRARRFYKRNGYRVCGKRTFTVGGVKCSDVIAVRDFTARPLGEWAYPLR